ncbi:MAG: type III pantothenate kinase [Oscillospiraceae bacterium]|nr:type III pantothenate kinase [Oscillospiraceae bacterium]
MLLAIDIGNSNITLGVFSDAVLLLKAKISARTERSADEYAALLYDLLRLHEIPKQEITGCILSSVVPTLTSLVETAACTVASTQILRVGPGIRTGFRIRIDDPSQLGGDLVADTLAALTDYGPPFVLIDAGTVTTIAAVDNTRTYLGGCILPGLRRSAGLLQETAALLPPIELAGLEPDCLGRNSIDAMRCGLLLGSAMMTDGFIDRYRALPNMAHAKCIATGGSARLVTARCSHKIIHDPDLTLNGLRYLYEGSRAKNPEKR